MTKARHTVVKEGKVGVYHCTSRCVRRAYLCGVDSHSGCDFSHRQVWVRDRLKALSKIFAIDVCGYAVMENHLHSILRNRPDIADSWSATEIAIRWRTLYPNRRDPQTKEPMVPNVAEIKALVGTPHLIKKFRKRLSSISWFMRNTNEWIARKANHEDGCKGHFWEGRFKAQALLDNASILTCSAYVALNPIHAGKAETPEGSDFTSIQDRILARQAQRNLANTPREVRTDPTPEQAQMLQEMRHLAQRADWLCPLRDQEGRKGFLNLDLDDYLLLVEWAGRQHRRDKAGRIPGDCAQILDRLELDHKAWLETIQYFDNRFYRVVGSAQQMLKAAKRSGQNWFQGISTARFCFKAE
ncbi:MAG: transposase [Acidobacteria bacterium]|nr:transposase [Acidobacteriota bacterium]MCB9396540.1 transposase [Acidobacteriota bacterium]